MRRKTRIRRKEGVRRGGEKGKRKRRRRTRLGRRFSFNCKHDSVLAVLMFFHNLLAP